MLFGFVGLLFFYNPNVGSVCACICVYQAVFGLVDVDNVCILIGRFLCHLARFPIILSLRNVEQIGLKNMFEMAFDLPPMGMYICIYVCMCVCTVEA